MPVGGPSMWAGSVFHKGLLALSSGPHSSLGISLISRTSIESVLQNEKARRDGRGFLDETLDALIANLSTR